MKILEALFYLSMIM